MVFTATATGSSLNWIHSKIISGAAFRINGLTKSPRIEFFPLDWIYHSIRIMTVSHKLYVDHPRIHQTTSCINAYQTLWSSFFGQIFWEGSQDSSQGNAPICLLSLRPGT